MAYDANIDYSSLKKNLQQQLATTTDPTQRAQLQSQIDAADQSRTEKIASDLYKYGQYATGSELDAAANYQATQSIGNSYDAQKKQAQQYYDAAKQNANNEALSRGMARSSYVQDRMSGLDTKAADALTDIDASKATAVYNAKNNILSDYRDYTANQAAQKLTATQNKAETLGAYGDFSGYSDLGYTPDQINNMSNAYKASLVAKTYSGSGSGGGNDTELTWAQLDNSMQDMMANVYDEFGNIIPANAEAAYQWALSNGGDFTTMLLGKWLPSYKPQSSPQQTQSTLYTPAQYSGFANNLNMNRTTSGIRYAIQNAYNNGKITEAQADELLTKYGIDH